MVKEEEYKYKGNLYISKINTFKVKFKLGNRENGMENKIEKNKGLPGPTVPNFGPTRRRPRGPTFTPQPWCRQVGPLGRSHALAHSAA
jgi:hypothetical protein